MIGKFTEWLLENTDLLNEKICSGAGKWPRIEVKDIATKITDAKLRNVIGFIIKNLPKDTVQLVKVENPTSCSDINEIYIGVNVERKSGSHEYRKELYNDFFENSGVKEDSKSKSFLTRGCNYVSLDSKFFNEISNKYVIEFANERFSKMKFNDKLAGDKESVVNLGSYTIDNKNKAIIIDTIFKFKFEPSGYTSNASYINSAVPYANALLGKLVGQNITSTKILKDEIMRNIKASDIEREVYDKLLDNYGNTVVTTNFYTDEKYKLSNGKSLGETLYNSNIMTVASEIIIPYMLLCGVKTIDGIDIIKAFAGDSKNKTVQAIKYPKSNTNFFADYSVVFVKDNKTNDIEEYKVSSKTGSGNKISLFTLYNQNKTIFENAKGLIGKAAKYCNKNFNDVKLIKAKFTWILGALACGMNYSEVDTLLKQYDVINAHLPAPETLKYFKSLKQYGIDTTSKAFPYTLTDTFNKKACEILNNDNKIKELITDMVFGNKDSIQIYITPMTKKFAIKIVGNVNEKTPNIKFDSGSTSSGTNNFSNINSLKDAEWKKLREQLVDANSHGSMLGIKFE